MDSRKSLCAVLLLSCACASHGVRRFPLREAMWKDTDFAPWNAPCRADEKDPKKKVCMPAAYESSFAWDGADNIIFRPVSMFFKVDPGGEAANVNAMDEVPDSAWFTNRIGVHPMTIEEIKLGSCTKDVLDPETDPPGSWLIDQGKPNGANPGFRVKTPKGKFFLKADVANQPEKGSGAAAIAARFYHAAGWWAPCDSVVYYKTELLSLKPGLMVTDNTGVPHPFDEKALAALLTKATKRGEHDEYTRMVASKFLSGIPLGPFTYAGLRDDDPNDIIPHEDRRDLRGARVIAAWLNHFDSREQNSMNTWMAMNPKAPDSSPGYIRHWYLDLGDCFGSEWDWEGITRRLGHAYYLDIPYLVEDFVTLGLIDRPWDHNARTKDGNIFAYFTSEDFQPDVWRGGYPNPTFNRMTELDAAWATRTIARFTRDQIEAAVSVGDFTHPEHSAYLVYHLLRRQKAILERYFSQLSPVTDMVVNDGSRLCGVDLARRTETYEAARFEYSAAMWAGGELGEEKAPAVSTGADGLVCVALEHFAKDGGDADDSPARYAVVDIHNGATPGPLRAHLYDLGPAKGYKLVGLERPKTSRPPVE